MKEIKLKKKNCLPCQALNDINSEFSCELGYVIIEAEKKNGHLVPQSKGPCPRPLSEKGFHKHMYELWKKTKKA